MIPKQEHTDRNLNNKLAHGTENIHNHHTQWEEAHPQNGEIEIHFNFN